MSEISSPHPSIARRGFRLSAFCKKRSQRCCAVIFRIFPFVLSLSKDGRENQGLTAQTVHASTSSARTVWRATVISGSFIFSQILKRLVHLKHPVFVARILLVSEIFDANSCESFVQSNPILHQTPAHSTIRQSISLLWEHVKTPERFSYLRNASS